jgi:dynein heavy chain
VHIQNFQDEIQEIIEQANTEMKYEQIVQSIGEEWDALDLTVIPYKNNQDSYILIEYDTVFTIIEEHMTTLESVQDSMFAAHIKDQIQDWIKNLKIMHANLEKWVESQNNWMYLEPIFNSMQMQNILSEEIK